MLCFLITLQRYDIIFIYARQLTLIKFFLYFYTFSLTHIYARTLYKTKHMHTDGCTPVQTKAIYMCVIACLPSVCWHHVSTKRATKTHQQQTQNKPLNAPPAKRTPPRSCGSPKVDYPTSNFFLNFF